MTRLGPEWDVSHVPRGDLGVDGVDQVRVGDFVSVAPDYTRGGILLSEVAIDGRCVVVVYRHLRAKEIGDANV